jgi:hypothetical protein
LAASKMVTLKKMTALMPENCCPNMSSRVIKSGFRFCRLARSARLTFRPRFLSLVS